MINLNIGLIGAGRWGPNVLGAINRIPSAQISNVADLNVNSLYILKEKFGNLKTTTNPNDLFSDESLNAVAICTPVQTHLDFAEKALTAGKHVFIEKPFGHNTQICHDLCKMAAQKNLIIVVGHVFLFNSSIIALKEIITSGSLGQILHIEAHRTNLGPVRNDVNAAWDLSAHDISIFDFLLDSLPDSVSCLGSCKLDTQIEDTTYTSLKYPNGVLAHAHASWLNPRKVRQITVIGSQKMALWDDLNMDHPITIYDSSIGFDQSYYSDSFASHRLSYNRGDVTLPSVPSNEPLFEELKHFVNVINGKEQNRSSGTYGAEVVRSLETADLSLRDSGKFIDIERP